MVDVGGKEVTSRRAAAEALLRTRTDVVAQILSGGLPKGDALAVARVAGIMAAKRTPDLVPLCHPLPLSGVTVDFSPEGPSGGPDQSSDQSSDQSPDAVRITAEVRTSGRTGVEMEALTAVSVAALTLYDMIKALDRTAEITGTRVVAKSGGSSGGWSRG